MTLNSHKKILLIRCYRRKKSHIKEEVLLHEEGTSDFKKEAGCFEKLENAKSKAFLST